MKPSHYQKPPSWENWFVREVQALSTPQTVHTLQKTVLAVRRALASSSYKAIDDLLKEAISSLQKMVEESETEIVIDDHEWIGKQVVFRKSQEEDKIIYGQIESSLVCPGSVTSDTWVVKVQSGYQFNADSNAFVFYNGPQYQLGEQVFYWKNGPPLRSDDPCAWVWKQRTLWLQYFVSDGKKAGIPVRGT